MKYQRGFAHLALILLVALPLFVFAVTKGNFNIIKRAATGEPPTPTPKPSPTSTPTRTPGPPYTSTPKPSWPPSPTATATPITNSVPVISTKLLPTAHKGRPYRMYVSGYDKDLGDTLIMDLWNLPPWLTLTGCSQTIKNSTKVLTCQYGGTPPKTDIRYTIRATLSDNHDGLAKRGYVLLVLPY